MFLTILELAQLQYMTVMVGEGRNNFIIQWNDDREPDPVEPGSADAEGAEVEPEGV
jgi:segregation and condensation protein A